MRSSACIQSATCTVTRRYHVTPCCAWFVLSDSDDVNDRVAIRAPKLIGVGGGIAGALGVLNMDVDGTELHDNWTDSEGYYKVGVLLLRRFFLLCILRSYLPYRSAVTRHCCLRHHASQVLLVFLVHLLYLDVLSLSLACSPSLCRAPSLCLASALRLVVDLPLAMSCSISLPCFCSPSCR